jgi:oligopeptide/dipeptide ABC transporter ATP-binding protein
MTQPLLSIEKLEVQFGPKAAPLTAVRGVSLDVNAGEIVGLIGESGSGKSLTCRSVMRLIQRPGRISAGTISYEGTDVLAMDTKALREFRAHQAGMIYQDPFSSLNPVRTIGSQLVETLRVNLGMPKTEAHQHAIGLLDGVGIPDPDKRVRAYPHELSGGQRQRVMIALATASRPRLLLADEPTTALDVTTQAQILDLICHLRDERGMGVLLVSHDFGVIAQVCDRVAVMYGGHIVESGPIATIYEHAEHPYARALLESVPELESAGAVRRRTGIRGTPPELSEVQAGCPFMPRCDHAVESCSSVSMALEELEPGHVSACPVRPFGNPADPASSLERVA